MAVSSAAIDMTGPLPRGLTLTSKADLVEVLRRWLAESHAETIGDIGRFGGKAWISVQLPGHEIVLNADCRRDAIERFVRANASQPNTPWQVVANRRGRVNKVLPVAGSVECPGWYAYLMEPLNEEGTIW